jgi:putative aldouronate transport system substrate-binding protein
MKMKQKVISCTLIMLMVISIITGCTKKDQTEDITETESKDTTTQSVETLGEEKPVIKFLGPDLNFDIESDPGSELIQEITGYKMEFTGLPQGDERTTKLLLLLSSGESYDVLKMQNDDYIAVLANNGLLPLNDLIDKYGENIMKYANKEMWNYTTKDGEKYGIVLEELRKDFISSGIMYRKDLFEEHNIEIPSNIEEFYNMLLDVKNKFPNAIPITFAMDTAQAGSFAYTSVPLVPVASAFDIDYEWKEVDGKLKYLIETNGFKEYLKFMHKLYQEKLIDKEFSANKGSNCNEKLVSGKAIMKMSYPQDGKDVVKSLRKEYNITNEDIGFLPVLESKDGTKTAPYFSGVDRITGISVTSNNPEHAVNWINICMDPEINTKIWIGEEDVDHYIENGEYYPILPRFFELRQNIYWYNPAYIDELTSKQWVARVRKDPDMEFTYQAITDAAQGAGKINPAGNIPVFDSGKYVLSLRTYVIENIIKFIMMGNIDEEYDAFVAKWKADGGEVWEKEVNDKRIK